MKYLILFFLLPLFFFTSAHKFYVSVTDIEYNPEAESLQIISRVFTDDMQNLLKERYNEDLFLAKEEEHPHAETFLEKYISKKLKITVNGTSRDLHYLGKEYDNDQLVLYIEVKKVEPVRQISVENTILTDLFPGQKNVIKVQVGDVIKSLLLSNGRESGLLNFSN